MTHGLELSDKVFRAVIQKKKKSLNEQLWTFLKQMKK